ncbi:hypothetical protein J2847_004103 [Azospirillum agricola]|uniref:hypothetical protein n=1 Tax=Azospirillum agricola TaxID=1720247 RepID=UPI001AE2E0CF|nr:hypothetical protein [Azospirillum agricola]MBP2230794.1 hypothetical protein [Azospirillum agricola]
MAEGRYKSSAELYGAQGEGVMLFGVRGYAAEGDEFPTVVYRAYAASPDQAHEIIRASGMAEGIHLGEPRNLSCGAASGTKAPHLEYAGPWPWPGKAA